MATQVTKIQTLRVALNTQPGALGEVYNAFREANVNVIACCGYEIGPGKAEAVFYASDTNRAKDVLTKMGKNPALGNACFAQGDDKVGVYADLLQKIAREKINLHATEAFGVGGKFAGVFFCEEKDVPTLCKALGC